MGSQSEALALSPSGSIVLAGTSTGGGPGGERTWLARLNADGTLDRTFGTGGYAAGQPGLAVSRAHLTREGQILALVSKSSGGGSLGIERFSPTGALDTTFGAQGVLWLGGIKSQVEGAFDSQGRVVVLGEGSPGSGPLVARFLAFGKLDRSFGHHGVTKVSVLGGAEPLRIAVESSGAIIVAAAGTSPAHGSTSPILLARLTATGTPDRGFGRRGVIQASRAFGTKLDVLGVGPDHGIFLARSTLRRSSRRAVDELVVARYTVKGPDRSFGKRAVARRITPTGLGAGLIIHAIAFEHNGNAVLVGEHRNRGIDVRRGTWFIARYDRFGRDCSFGRHGSVEGMEGGAYGVAVENDMRIVIAGWGPGHLPDGAGTAFMAARYFGGGTPMTCAGEGRHPT